MVESVVHAIPDAREAIDAVLELNRQYIDAVRSNDAAWFEQHMADDVLVITSAGSRQGKRAFIGAMPTDYRSLHVRDARVRVFGTVAQVDADALFELGDGTRGVSRYIDTYAWLDQRWQLISAQYIRLTNLS